MCPEVEQKRLTVSA